MMPTTNRLKTSSIARRLTASLLATVTIVACCAAAALYDRAAVTAERDLHNTEDEMLAFLSGALLLPLWEFNTPTLAAIGETLSQHELVTALVIKNRAGEIVYEKRKEPATAVTVRTRDIWHQGRMVGAVQIELTLKAAQQRQRELLRWLSLTTALILFAIGLVTSGLIRLWLRVPLQRLNALANAYAAGHYDTGDSALSYAEFQPFGNALASMGATIQQQMHALRESERRLKNVLEILPVGVWITDKNGTIIHGNSAGQQIWSGARYVPKEQFDEYKAWWAATGERITPEEWGASRAIANGEIAREEEIEIECFDGTHKIMLNWAMPMLGEHQEIEGAVAVNQDITERKRAEEQIREHNRLLEEAVQQKQRDMEALFERLLRQEKLATIGQMAGSIAHELRNPLGAVKQSIFYLKQLAQKQELTASNPKVLRHLELIDGELNASEQVIADLLDMTRMKPPQIQPTDARALLADAVNRAHLPPQVRVTIALESDSFLIAVDPLQLRQVLLNVLNNAAQAIEGEGTITIQATQSPERGEAVITVHDTGAGIAPEALEKAFEPLYTTKANGTGLGLSICKQIIEHHQGRITLTSQPGQGATVTIVLPRNDA